jgi:hypothetical protein
MRRQLNVYLVSIPSSFLETTTARMEKATPTGSRCKATSYARNAQPEFENAQSRDLLLQRRSTGKMPVVYGKPAYGGRASERGEISFLFPLLGLA